MMTIKRMGADELAGFIPKIGDRFAVVDFCCQSLHISSKRKDSLLDKLREKLKKKKGESSSCVLHEKEFKSNLKPNRQIQIGWLTFEKNRYVQVRMKQGGGVRTVSVDKDCTCVEIMDLGKKLFFTDGMSSKGHESQFDFSLRDFKCEKIIEPYTVAQLYNLTGLTRLKFYLCTNRKENNSTNVLSQEIPGTMVLSDESETEEDIIKRAIDRSYCPLPSTSNDSEDYESEDNEVTYEIITVISEPDTQTDDVNGNDNSVETQLSHMDRRETRKIILHRGQLLQELVDEFMSLNVDSKIEIEIFLPNKQKEKAFDGGGVFRDTLSEFWQTFYDEYTVGTASKVPILRHDFNDERWAAVAKILAKGLLEENYFPVQLSKTFLERTIFGRVHSDLTSDLLDYMPRSDAELIKCALNNFDVDYDDLLDCLDTFQCKWKPTKDNFKKLMEDVADKEMIQKPMFVIDCWRPILNGIISFERFEAIYHSQKGIVKNVLKILEFDDNLSAAQQNIAGYLRRFIKECDQKLIGSFLRYVTGANMLIGIPIHVSFTESSSEFTRTPTAHTCNCLLMLPSNYNSYPEFRNEFEKLLNSNIWVMDIV